MVYLSVIIIPAVVISVLLIVLFAVLKKRGKLERVSSYGLALVLLVFWIAVYGLSCLNLDYRAAHFPYTQPDTTWTTESGNITVRVGSDGGYGEMNTCDVSVVYDGKTYDAGIGTFSLDRVRPMSLYLLDEGGIVEYSFSFRYRMPNDHTLIMTPTDKEASQGLLDGEGSITLSRIDS